MMSCLYIFQLCNCLHRLQIICSHQQTGLQSVRVHNKITFIVEEVQSIPIIFEHPSIKKLISYYTRNIGKSEMSTISHSALLLSVFGIGTFLGVLVFLDPRDLHLRRWRIVWISTYDSISSIFHSAIA